MGIVDLYKYIVGYNRYFKNRQFIKFLRDECFFAIHRRITCDQSINIEEYAQRKKHVFFGYYDIQQINKKENKMLVHVVDKNADTKSDIAEIGFYDLKSKEYVYLTQTRAWCWQQGARLRWNPINEEQILYSDVEGNNYVTRVFSIKEKKVIRTISAPLYDIDNEMKVGISVNFSRIQRLRPGYGYDALEDTTIGKKAPENDGVYLVDIEKDKKKLIISLKELSKNIYDDGEHYINHISISPDGKKFMFFHIWTIQNSEKWKTRLYVYDIYENKLILLEDDTELVSHYDWSGNDNIIITSYDVNQKLRYYIYSISGKSKKMIKGDGLLQDGHPTVLKEQNIFVSDTYPIKYDMQTLFLFDMNNMKRVDILKAYSNPNLYGEYRCDMHPRISETERFISLDSTVKNGTRRVLLVDGWKGIV